MLRLRRLATTTGLLLLLAAGSAHAQPMVLQVVGVADGWIWQEGRVWTGPRAVGQAGVLDRIGFEPSTGDLVVSITGHPARSGEEGRYAVPGECVMRLSRPDLAGATLVIETPDEGASLLTFHSSRGLVTGRLRVSAGCDTTGAY